MKNTQKDGFKGLVKSLGILAKKVQPTFTRSKVMATSCQYLSMKPSTCAQGTHHCWG